MTQSDISRAHSVWNITENSLSAIWSTQDWDIGATEDTVDINTTEPVRGDSYGESQHAVELFTLSVIMSLSTSGNIMVFYVIGRYLHFKTVTNVFIVSLALSDLLTTLVCMSMTFAKLAGGSSFLSGDTCVINGFLNASLGVVSTLMTMFIAVDRYYVVVKLPKGAVSIKLACLLVATCWILAGFLGFPWHLVVSNSSTHHGAYSQEGYHHCMYIFHVYTSPDGIIYSSAFIVISYMVPGGILGYCTLGIWRTISRNDSRIRPATTHVNQLRFSGELRTAKTVVFIVVFYFVCRLPYGLLGIGFALAQSNMSIPVDTLALWLFWSSCAVNPVIYALRNPVLAQALHLRRTTDYERRQLNNDSSNQSATSRPVGSLANSSINNTASRPEGENLTEEVNAAQIAVSLTRSDHRSDSIPSVLLFSAARKGSTQSTGTTSTNV